MARYPGLTIRFRTKDYTLLPLLVQGSTYIERMARFFSFQAIADYQIPIAQFNLQTLQISAQFQNKVLRGDKK